jgi:hypothetical protein
MGAAPAVRLVGTALGAGIEARVGDKALDDGADRGKAGCS